MESLFYSFFLSWFSETQTLVLNGEYLLFFLSFEDPDSFIEWGVSCSKWEVCFTVLNGESLLFPIQNW